MRLPSLRLLIREATSTFVRFPFVLVAAFVAAGAGVVAVDFTAGHDLWLKIFLVALLGVPLSFALGMVSEKRDFPHGVGLTLSLTGFAALAAYYFTLPSWMTPAASLRYTQLSIGIHLLVAFSPFVGSGEINGFWQYNKALFLRFLLSALYSIVLFLGLMIALLAIDNLFGVDIDGETYFRLWTIISIVFNTWFFLGGVPPDLSVLEESVDYPKGLKVFTQYILIPLIILYLVILTTYLGKVILTRIWPSGWIGYLVSSVASAGILALLLVHPIRDLEGNKWVRTYARWFYIALFPAIGMLVMAIWKRIDQYGVTEPRYFLAVLAAWLGLIALYFTFTRSQNIKLIPTTLAAVAFATSLGPWGAYSVSVRSQTNRLEKILVHNEILVDGRVRPAEEDIEFEDRREVSAILRYLVGKHGVRSIEPWFGGELAQVDTLGDTSTALRAMQTEIRARAIAKKLGIEYAERWRVPRESNYFHYRTSQEDYVHGITEYDYFVRLVGNDVGATEADLGDGRHTLVFDPKQATVRVTNGDVLVEVDLQLLVRRVRGGDEDPTSLSREALRITADNPEAGVTLYVNYIVGEFGDDGLDLSRFAADCFVEIK